MMRHEIFAELVQLGCEDPELGEKETQLLMYAWMDLPTRTLQRMLREARASKDKRTAK